MSHQSEPCPTCNAVDCKRWQMFSGQWVCDECWLDVAMDIQQHHFKVAQGDVMSRLRHRDPSIARASRCRGLNAETNPALCPTPDNAGPRASRPGTPDALAVKGSRFRLPLTTRMRQSLDSTVKPGYNSVCLLCSHIFYGAAMASCSRCGGLCQLRTDHDLQLQTRHSTRLIEAEK